MQEYKRAYLRLFNAVTDALSDLERQDFGAARDLLIRARQEAEEQIVEGDEGADG